MVGTAKRTCRPRLNVGGRFLSQISLHLADIGGLAVQQLLAQCVDLLVLLTELMEGFQTLDHAPGVALNHHVGNFGVGVPAAQLHPGHEIRPDPYGGVKLVHVPAPLGGDGMGFGFDGIVFPKLGFQRFPQPGTHTGVQHTANADLPHLGGFQDGGQNFSAVFHKTSPHLVCTFLPLSCIK